MLVLDRQFVGWKVDNRKKTKEQLAKEEAARKAKAKAKRKKKK